jgi:MFS transporter, DHA1 family, tetracycline resistance protein
LSPPSALTRSPPTWAATPWATHGSLWELGLLLGIYDGAEVVLKPVIGALADRTGPKPVMIGGLMLFAAASARS